MFLCADCVVKNDVHVVSFSDGGSLSAQCYSCHKYFSCLYWVRRVSSDNPAPLEKSTIAKNEKLGGFASLMQSSIVPKDEARKQANSSSPEKRPMRKFLLVLGLFLGLAGKYMVDYAVTEVTRPLAQPSPAAAKLIDSMMKDADWYRHGSTLLNERIELAIDPANYRNRSCVVRKQGSEFAMPGFSGDDLRLISLAFDDAYRLAGERELAQHINKIDAPAAAVAKGGKGKNDLDKLLDDLSANKTAANK